jgi:hypothetical protein
MHCEFVSKKHDTIGILVLTSAVAWFADEFILTSRVPFFRDLGPYFYPMRFSLAEALNQGELPLWNRHMSLGFPLLANFQSGTFYPPHLLFLVLPFFRAIQMLYLFHYMVAATGAYAVCRYWKYPGYVAVMGGMFFTLGGTLVSLSNLLNHFQTAVWLPWVILFWERSLLVTTWKNFLPFSILLLLQLLAGSPELYFMTLGLLLLDGIRIGGRRIIKLVIILGAANGLVVGLGMVQILPTIELLIESRGGHPVDYAESSMWSLQPWSLINLFFIDKEINPKLLNALNLFFLRNIPLLISQYLGPLCLLGILLWLWSGTRREKIVLLLIVTISLVLCAGSYTPLYFLLHSYLPSAQLFRFPEKFFFVTYASLVFIALKGLHTFLNSRSTYPVPSSVLLLPLGIFVGLYLYCRLDSVPLARLIAWTTQENLFSPSTIEKTSAALLSLERQVALMTGFSLLLFLASKGKLSPVLLHILMPGLLFVDLNSANQPHHHLLEPEFVFRQEKILEHPGQDFSRIFYYPAHSNLHPSFYILARQPPPSFGEVPPIVFATLLPHTGLFYGFDYMQEIDALRRWPYVAFLDFANKLPPEDLFRLLGALNVRFVVSFQTLNERGISLIRSFAQYPSWLYEVNTTVPRTYIVARSRAEQVAVKILGRLASQEFDPMQEVILDRSMNLSSPKNFRSHAQIIDYQNQTVTIHASLSSPGLLILTDAFYPGWHAYVDGKEEQILRANLFFRGVYLREGAHRVEFRYEPRAFTIGLIISFTTTLCLALWTAYRIFRVRRS